MEQSLKPSTIYEALALMVAYSGKSHKEIACELRPTKSVESAKSWFSRCLNEEDDWNFTPEDIDHLCRVTGRADILINYLCDAHGFERPSRKLTLPPEKENKLIKEFLHKKGVLRDYEEFLKDNAHIISLEVKRGR